MGSTERISRPFFPSQLGDRPEEGNAFIFVRDLPLGIMPIRGRQSVPSYKVEPRPADDASVDRMIHLLNVDGRRRNDLERALIEFIENAAHRLAVRGEVYFELVLSKAGIRREAQLAPLPAGRVVRAPYSYLQVIPKADRKELGESPFIRIPGDRIWHLKLPRELGGVRGHRRMLRQLGERSAVTPRFIFQTTDVGGSVGYDLKAHRRAVDISVERATRRWGTMPSFGRVNGTTEYFLFSRRLAFKRAQALLREKIVSELNGWLGRLEIGRIEVSGIPTVSNIDETLKRMHAGEITVTEAMELDTA